MFSKRLDWARPQNPLARTVAARTSAGAPLLDLTESNPTRVGLAYPTGEIVAALADPGVARYEPTARGLVAARAAVAGEYRRRGAEVAPDAIVLTASSSESYAILFKLLADPGDAVLVPEPSYPLFEYLARLEGVEPRGYRLAFDGEWHLDFTSLARAAAAGHARAVVTVSPNNPTGSFLKPDELERLARFCAERDLALITDEVFADYPADMVRRDVVTVAGRRTEALTFSLGGLSKSCGLPQLKLGWIVLGGPAAAIEATIGRLELVADTYLSVATPVQVALPRLLDIGARIRTQIAARLATNRAALGQALGAGSPCTLLPSEGGWYAILRLPATHTDEEWVLRLCREDGLLVHPGYFYDMPPGAFLVVSLLPELSRFGEGVDRIVARCGSVA